MKKYILIGLALAVVLGVSTFLYQQKLRKEEAFAPLLKRQGIVSSTAEWRNTKAAIEGLQSLIRKNSNDYKSKYLLALAYMQEARVTGEHPYYYPAAMDLIENVLDGSGDERLLFEATTAKATILLSLHHFEEGLKVGKEAKAMDSSNASVYGILCDANVELGNYTEAVAMADKMASIRPDMRSYARVSYLREIHGDMPGAIEAMKLAVSSGYPGLEQSAWTRVTLGQLYEKTGDLQSAEDQYKMAMAEYNHYAFAVGGLGRLEAKKKNFDESIKLLTKAAEIIPEFSFNEELVHIYMLTGKQEKAREATKELLTMLEEDADAGHFVDLELANINIQITKDYDKALKYANVEYSKRPANIDVCKTLAHIYYRKKDYGKAKEFITIARRTNKQVPDLLCLQGLIDVQTGQKSEGLKLIKQSFDMDPFQQDDLTSEAKQLLSPVASL